MWGEFDHYETIKPACPKDAIAYKEKMERNQNFEFLAGLNADFEVVRVHIMSRDVLPSLNEVYAFA